MISLTMNASHALNRGYVVTFDRPTNFRMMPVMVDRFRVPLSVKSRRAARQKVIYYDEFLELRQKYLSFVPERVEL